MVAEIVQFWRRNDCSKFDSHTKFAEVWRNFKYQPPRAPTTVPHSKILSPSESVFQIRVPTTTPPTAWLTNDDLLNCIKQYASNSDTFCFPYKDYIKAGTKINISAKQWKQFKKAGFEEFGFFINVSQTHWVGYFVNVSYNIHEYFDSFGEAPSSATKKTLQHIQKMIKEHWDVELQKLQVNTVKYQTDAHNCGAWAVVFMIYRSEGCAM